MTSPTADQQEQQKMRQAAAEDLRLLAQLHGAELSAEALADLQTGPFEELLALQLGSQLAAEALQVINDGLQPDILAAMIDSNEAAAAATPATSGDEPTENLAPASREPLDYLAADFADIYLTHRLQLSPCESPWLEDDGLMNGKPMFEVRRWYERFGLAAEDWRVRGDDHISLQLSFIAHLLQRPEDDSLAEAGRFMDEHLLRWLPGFGHGVAQRCATPFYAGLGMLTYAYADELRSLIEEITGEPRTVYEEENKPGSDDDTAPFTGGAGPGW